LSGDSRKEDAPVIKVMDVLGNEKERASCWKILKTGNNKSSTSERHAGEQS